MNLMTIPVIMSSYTPINLMGLWLSVRKKAKVDIDIPIPVRDGVADKYIYNTDKTLDPDLLSSHLTDIENVESRDIERVAPDANQWDF